MPDDFAARLRDLVAARRPRRVKIAGAREAAVLIPFLAGTDPVVVFTVRTDTLSRHKGQISFPGGSIDPSDASAESAALREAHEEIGLDPAVVTVLGELDTVPTFVSGYTVTPFVGWIEERPRLTPNPAEVAALLEVPISQLNEQIRSEPGFEHGGRSYPTEAWVWNDHVIWGVTALVVRSLLTLLAQAGLVEAPGATRSWSEWRTEAGERR